MSSRRGLSVASNAAVAEHDVVRLIQFFHQMRPAARALLLSEAAEYARATAPERRARLIQAVPRGGIPLRMLRVTLDDDQPGLARDQPA
jgi:hypothetical protein